MRARAMATRWAVEDGQTGAGFIPRWTVRDPTRMPGDFPLSKLMS